MHEPNVIILRIVSNINRGLSWCFNVCSFSITRKCAFFPFWGYRILPKWERIYCWLLIALGLIGGASATYTALKNVISTDFQTPCYLQTTTGTNETTSSIVAASSSSHGWISSQDGFWFLDNNDTNYNDDCKSKRRWWQLKICLNCHYFAQRLFWACFAEMIYRNDAKYTKKIVERSRHIPCLKLFGYLPFV